VLCWRQSWNKVLACIKVLLTQAAVAELFSQDEFRRIAFAIASGNEAPVEVLESMILLGKLDAKKRNILDIAGIDLQLPLHLTAYFHPDPSALKLVVRHHHPALLAKDSDGATPLGVAFEFNKSHAVSDLLRKLITAYKHGHFSALIRFCGTSDDLQALAVSTTDDVPLLVLCECDS